MTEIVAGLGESAPEVEASAEKLFPLVYDELRRLARGYMSREQRHHTLQPTALVNEAYTRLVDLSRIDWRGRTHFFAVGAQAMRRILIDHARSKGSLKRGGDWQRITLAQELHPSDRDGLGPEKLLDLHRALARLRELDERQARIAELASGWSMPTGWPPTTTGPSLSRPFSSSSKATSMRSRAFSRKSSS